MDDLWYKGTPVAFPSDDIAKKYEFPPEAFDEMIPSGGFVSDFVLGSRDIASPTLFGIWNGIYLISSVMKRLAFYSWADTILVPNLFMIMVAPPGVVKKSTQLNKGLRILKDVDDHIQDPYMAALRIPKTRKGAMTPEAMHDELVPETRIVTKPNGKFRQVSTGSNLNIVVSELTTLIDKKKYNLGLIDKLTSLFDSSDIGEDKTTKTDGVKELREIYVTMAGATTPESMRNAFPEEALGGGFMSRAIIVYAHEPTRIYAMPPKYDMIPKNDELAKRLAWIIDHAKGEYFLSPRAFEAHTSWYRAWVREFMLFPEREQNLYARYDILILKLALLIRAQRYELGTEITLEDYNFAHKLLDATMNKTKSLIGHIQGSVDTDKEDEILRRVKSKNEKDGDGLMRKYLQGYVRSIYQGHEFKFAIRDLFARRELFSFDNGELRFDRPKERADEKYFSFPPELVDVNDVGTQLERHIARITKDVSLAYALDPTGQDEELEAPSVLEPSIY